MRALLLYPEMPDTFYGMRHFTKMAGRKAPYPPLGLLTVAAMLPEAWERRLVDLNVRNLTEADLAWADLVLISAMNVQEESVREILERCRAVGAVVVAGGPLFTHEHHRFEGVAHFVLNEAEITLPLFLQDLERGEAKPMYVSTEFADVSTTPLPDLSLVDPDVYLYAIVQYSRGCPYMCDFCDVTTLYGRRPRVKSFDQIRVELENIMRSGTTNTVLFADDNLIGNKRVLKADILPKLIEWRRRVNCPLFFVTQLTVNLADDDELMRLLLEAGFRHVFIGIETPDAESLDHTRKTQNLKRDLLEDVRKLHRSGFIVAGGFIVGFDTDTDDVFDRQIRFIQSSGIPFPIVNLLKAPPGTELYDRVKAEGRIVREFAFTEGETNIATVMDSHHLAAGYRRLIEAIHSPEGSFERITGFLSDYSYPRTETRIPSRPFWQYIAPTLRLVWSLGILNPRESQLWRYVGWVLRHRPGFIEAAFIHAAMTLQMYRTSLHTLETLDANLKAGRMSTFERVSAGSPDAVAEPPVSASP